MKRGREGSSEPKAQRNCREEKRECLEMECSDDQEQEQAWEYIGWWWGVEDEMLLGWFPFENEDFVFHDGGGGEVASLWDQCFDIWHLHHIHQIPHSDNNS
ncbi:hypothetical protein J5N97_007523 [Dioscorea zingiberensis]|uniref:Uncharacterized protein n=1 Tax=Dioscorea zingiberensis TaxID=325984 RepID=A0A9D5DGA0_9LILI|nr:hypothetical protein J5N97_007523 [Dioscorea zingiberensis]